MAGSKPAAKDRVPPYEAFAARAKALTKAIPAEFLEGVEDVVVHRKALRHPLIDDVYTLGEQEPSPLVAWTGGTDSADVHSTLHLYYGSFVALAAEDPRFDVDAELRETIEHELQHHIEDRAGLRGLIDEDDLTDAHQRFTAGLDVPKGWWRQGERLGDSVWAVGADLFVELRLRRRELEARRGTTVTLTVLDEPFEAELPADVAPGAILTFAGEGLLEDDAADGDAAGDLHLIVDVR